LRQTYLDAQWYAAAKNKQEYNLSLEAWNQLQNLPQVFATDNIWDQLRADKLGDEFGVQYILLGGGNEYRRLDHLKATGATVIVPLTFPKPYDVEDVFDTRNVTLAEMKHWELAPANAAFMYQKGIPFCFTATGFEKLSEFLESLKKTVLYGLPESEALKALTY